MWEKIFWIPAYFIALSIWVGGMAVLAFLAAPTAFRELPTRAQAGAFFGHLLAGFSRVELICATVCLIASLVFHLSKPTFSGWAKVQWFLLAFMMVIAGIHDFYVIPQARAIRVETAESPEAPSESLRSNFAALHRASEILFGLNLLAGMALVGVSTRAMGTYPTPS